MPQKRKGTGPTRSPTARTRFTDSRAEVLAGQTNLLSMAESLTGVGYWRINFADASVIWSNAVYKICGLDRASFDPNDPSVMDIYHPDDRPVALAHIEQAMASQTGFEYEARVIRTDGAIRSVNCRAVCEFTDQGDPVALVGVFHDVTEQRRAETERRQSAERLARIVELLPAGAVHVQSGVLSMNAAMEKVTGYSRQEIPTLDAWFELLYGDTSGKLIARYQDQRANGFPATVTGFIRRKDGEQRRIEFRACNDSIGEIWIVEDITERDQIERELIAAKDRAEIGARSKSEFLANMSHELRTPLTAIIGFAGLLGGEGILPPRERSWVARVEDASKALHSIVNDVLDFSKLEDGAVELECEPFGLCKLVEDTAALLADQAGRKGVGLDIEIAETACDRLMGDTGRLRQVLLNLMSNAVKFTTSGSVVVRVREEAGCDERVHLRFEVVDTGIGIPAASLSRLFQRFVQADGSISRKFGGTGLGLAISRRLVELMDGEIGVESTLGEGSTFWFTVSLAVAPETEQLADLDIAIDAGAIRLLLVEDAEANQELVSTILRSVGVEVDIASNGAEAVDAVQVSCYDLVLMDVQMPVMDGVQATQMIRKLGGDLANLPIIALSANVLPEQVAEYHRAGMNAHLSKPINPREMLAAIGYWASARDAEPEPERLLA
jgi:PAS domain S-box-containing protein